jgi:hypothetical protein
MFKARLSSFPRHVCLDDFTTWQSQLGTLMIFWSLTVCMKHIFEKLKARILNNSRSEVKLDDLTEMCNFAKEILLSFF